MTGRLAGFPRLSGDEAVGALRWLVAAGKLTSKQVRRALRDRSEFVEEIKGRLEALGGQSARFLTGPAALERKAPGKRKRRKASPKARRAWALQGKYLGAVRRLSKPNRAKVKAIRERSGVRAATAAAWKLAPRSR